MTTFLKWMLPMTAALGLVMGVATLSSRAAEEGKEKDAPKTAKGNIAGTVTDKGGKAVEGVEVRLMKPRQRGGGGGGAGGGAAPSNQANPGHKIVPLAQGPTPIATAKTDKDGKFTMNDVAVGEYNVGVRDADKKVYGREKVTVEDGKTATVEIKCTDTPPQRGGGGGGGNGGGNAPK